MKKSSKILIVILAAVLLVGTLALATFASSGVDGKFVVDGAGYETWAEAVAAADNTHTIYLNENWTLDKGITLSGEATNVRLNLNGKTVSVSDGTPFFNVHTNAKLTIEGAGTFDNKGAQLIGASNYGEVTFNATGAGVVINNSAASGNVDVFRFTSYSTLNVSGKIVVNTNSVTNNRTIFNIADSNKKTVNLNIKDADILFATPTVSGAPVGKVIYSQFSNVKIDDSRLEGVYCYVIWGATTGTVNLAGYIVDRDASSAVNYGWDPNKLAELKSTVSIDIAENYTVNNTVIASTKATGYTGNISGSMMYFTGATKADFTNCVIYGHYRAIYGKQANTSWNSVSSKQTDASQLTFVDCHIRACEGGSIPYLVCYGPNARFFGGSVSGVGQFANCQPHYVELDNGQWLGVYVDNVLGLKGLDNDVAITTAWQNATAYNPESTIVETLPNKVSITVDGKTTEFTTGYFSDEDLYESYLPPAAERHVWDDYIVQKSDANVEGGSFVKDGANAAVGTNPLGTAYTFGTTNGTTTYVYDAAKGNGYIKHFMAKNTGSQPSTSNYQQIVTTQASIATTDAYVWEWDVSTDDKQFINVSFAAQGREKLPRFDANGNYLGFTAGLTRTALKGTNYITALSVSIKEKGTFEFNEKSVALSTAKGEWSRITVVMDIVRGELTTIDVPACTSDGTNVALVDGVTVKKEAYSIVGSKIHVYVNGALVDSIDFPANSWGYNGYIIKGYESNYYFDQIRIFPGAAGADGSYCVDNVRTSVYPIGADFDLGLYEIDAETGEEVAKKDITGLEHFLIMPDNNAPVIVKEYAGNVDGVDYETEEELIEAIKDGSVVELYRDMKTPIDVDAIRERLGLETISFRIINGKYSFAGVISENHKLVDYTGAFGGYRVAPAGVSEIYTLYLYDEIFGISDTNCFVAEGTLYPPKFITAEGEEASLDGKLWSILGWKDSVGGKVANGYCSVGNATLKVTPDYKSLIYYYEIAVNGTVKYVTNSAFGDGIEEALAKGDVKVVFWQNVELDSSITVKGNLEIDLNGCCATALDGEYDVFKVLSGTKINLYSSREGACIDASGAETLFDVEYDRRRAGDIEINVSDADVIAEGFVNYYDSYVHDSAMGKDSYVYFKTFDLNLSNVSITSSASGVAAITSALPVTVIADTLNYTGASALIEVLPDERASLNASFKNSSFVASENLVNIPGENRSVSFEGCYFDAPLSPSYEIVEEEIVFGKETIKVGKDCSFTQDVEAVTSSGVSFEAGCIVVPADKDGIKSYVNTPDAMAIVSWLGKDGNPIAEPVYNAPFGKPVEILTWDEANEKIGLLEENDWYFIAFDGWDIADDFELTAGAVGINPKWKAPEASINCLKLDLVAYTYFKLNLYLPDDAPEGVELYGIYREANDDLDHKRDPRYKLIDGKWYELLETGEAEIGGKKYSSYSVYPGAADASEPEYKVAFDVNGMLLVDTVYCGVPTYAETAMKGIMKEGVVFDELPENDKVLARLVMNMVRYANESYKLANESAVGAPKYEALLNTYSSLLINYDSISFSEKELNVSASELSEYMEGVSFIFGAYQPRFEFKYRDTALNLLVKPETSDGVITKWPDGNRGFFAVIYHENYDGTKSHKYIASHTAYNGKDYVVPDAFTGDWGVMTDAYATTRDLNIYNATGIINIELYNPEGKVVRGSYSLAAYITHIAETAANAKATTDEARAIASDAEIRAALAWEAAAKPENAALKAQYEQEAADYEATKLKNEGIAAENEAVYEEYSSFLDASLSLYAFSLSSQDYERTLIAE